MTPTTTYRVAAVQMDPKLGRLDENLHRILERLAEAAGGGAPPGRLPRVRPLRLRLLQPRGGDGACRPDRRARGAAGDRGLQRARCYAIFGLLERDGSRLFNACVLVGPEGVVGSYRKVHLPYLGIDMFVDPGDRPFAVHDAGGLRVGMHICYDGSFPESARVLSLLGADLLVLPTNWPTHSECAAEHMIPTRAMENTVYAMAVNRVGEESGFRFIGSSSIVDPNGRVLARRARTPRDPRGRDRPGPGAAEAPGPRPRPARDQSDRRPAAAVLRSPGRAQRAES